jgi:hypothetical protein
MSTVWLNRAPALVKLDGQLLPSSAYGFAQGLLRVPRTSFGSRMGERELRLRPASANQ